MNWKNMPLAHKIAKVVSCVAALVWVIAQLQPELFSVDPSTPAIAVFTVCEAVVYWESKRKWAYLFIAGAAISMTSFALGLFL